MSKPETTDLDRPLTYFEHGIIDRSLGCVREVPEGYDEDEAAEWLRGYDRG